MKDPKKEQKLLALWAANCAERLLPYFEKSYPEDNRPRKALEVCREWVRTGIFKMAVIRKASLDSHAAARKAKKDKNDAACFAARAAGQAVATAHVPQHAYGVAYYWLKLFSDNSKKAKKELVWQSQHLPRSLRKDWKDWMKKKLPKEMRKMIIHHAPQLL